MNVELVAEKLAGATRNPRRTLRVIAFTCGSAGILIGLYTLDRMGVTVAEALRAHFGL